MRLPSFFPRPLLGLQISDQDIRIGWVRRHGEHRELGPCHRVATPQGAVQNGQVLQGDLLVPVLRRLLTEMKDPLGRDVALCVSTAVVYGSMVTVPFTRIGEHTVPRDLCAQVLPEPVEELVIATRFLRKNLLGEEYALLCMRSDVLASFEDVCKQVGLHIAKITTLPMIAAALAHAQESGILSLLPHEQSATVFAHGWPIDEALLLGTETPSYVEDVRSLEREAHERGRDVPAWIVLGPQPVVQAIDLPTVPAQRFAALPEKQWEWLGICGACVPQTPAAFATLPWRRRVSVQWSLLCLALVLAVIAGFQFWSGIRSRQESALQHRPSQQQSLSSAPSSAHSSVVSLTSSSRSSVQQPSSAPQKSPRSSTASRRR